MVLLFSNLYFKKGVSKLWPVNQIWPMTCFCMAYKIRMFFTFLNGWEKSKEENFMVHKNDVKWKFQCPHIKFNWNTAICLVLGTDYGCFCAAKAELRSCDRDHVTYKVQNIYYLDL